MQPQELSADKFAKYPPLARKFAIQNLPVLQKIPLALAPILLREVIDYDWRFPVEQRVLARQFVYLQSLSSSAFAALMAPFAAVHLPVEMEKLDWVNQPQLFSEQLSATLWSTRAMDDYRKAAKQYQNQLQEALVEKPPAVPRFTVVVVGQGVAQTQLSLFRPLRPHGALFTAVQPAKGLQTILQFVNQRAAMHPEEYAHWYIDGGVAEAGCGPQQGVMQTSYSGLATAALQELTLTNKFVENADNKKTVGPEAVQSYMATLRPEDLGMRGGAQDAALRHFEVKVLTEGAGAQVFSTTFVQWSAREAMRRAQPITMLARYAPRQRMAPMNELMKRNPMTQATDPEGSLVDADMGAYYTWINQSRLAGAEQARFLAWYEGHNVALAIAPGLARGSTSDTPANLEKIFQWMS